MTGSPPPTGSSQPPAPVRGVPNWIVAIAVLAIAMLLLLAFGSFEAVKIFALMGAWFFLLGLVALAGETLIQLISRTLRRG